jgi:hypothetical protein
MIFLIEEFLVKVNRVSELILEFFNIIDKILEKGQDIADKFF